VEGFLLPGALRTAPDAAKRQDLDRDLSRCLRSEAGLSIVVIGNYTIDPITADIIPSESTPFTPSSILFRPHLRGQMLGCPNPWGGGAGYRPRVR
jgi:hypothetical protein